MVMLRHASFPFKLVFILHTAVCCTPPSVFLQVLEICAHFGGLQAARTEMMGLFVYDLGPIDEEKVGLVFM